MKLLDHRIERKSNNIIHVYATCRDRFRKPAHLKVTFEECDTAGEQLVMSGDVMEYGHVINSLGEIAWAAGWRPAGLVQGLTSFLQTFKAKPMENNDKS